MSLNSIFFPLWGGAVISLSGLFACFIKLQNKKQALQQSQRDGH